MPDAPQGAIRYIGIVIQGSESGMEAKVFTTNSLQIKWQLFQDLPAWQMNPLPLTFPEGEYTGDPAEEYAEQDAGWAADKTQICEVEADEFESVYHWFLS
jgi:hypothetical protein